MQSIQDHKSFHHFAKHLFIAGKIYIERNRAKEDVASHLQRMRKSIIRMSLTYSEIDNLKAKINNLVDWERRYAKLFRAEDKQDLELKKQLESAENELRKEREEKQQIINDNNNRILELTESLNNIKSKTNELLMERARRHHRFRALESKINGRVDLHYRS